MGIYLHILILFFFIEKMGTTPKRKRSTTSPASPQTTPKRRSMRILSARFSGTRSNNAEASGTPTVVTVDDDSDDDDITDSEIIVSEQENVDDIGSTHEDSDEDHNDNRNEAAFAYSSDCPGGQGGSDAFFESAGGSACHFSAEPVTNASQISSSFPSVLHNMFTQPVSILQVIAESSSLVAVVADPAQSPLEVSMLIIFHLFFDSSANAHYPSIFSC